MMSSRYELIELGKINPNKNQPRQYFNEESLKELASNIEKHGLLQPLLVRPKETGYELVLGERRYRACQLANVTQVTCEVRSLSDEEALEISLSENLQREDLTPIEEALSYKRYLDLGFTQQQIADKLDKSRSRIAQMLSLLKLSIHIQTLITQGYVTERHGRELLKLQKYCEQFDGGQMIGYGISDVLIKVWNHCHTITYGDAMRIIESDTDKEKVHNYCLALLIGINHIPDHVATRIRGAKITVKDLEKLTEDVKFAVIYLSTVGEHKHDFGIKVPLEDLEWLLVVDNRRGTNDMGKCFWANRDEELEGYEKSTCSRRQEVQRFIPALNAKVWFCRNCAKEFDEMQEADNLEGVATAT
jgi:ParB/RepB/Spo0J family partition protein